MSRFRRRVVLLVSSVSVSGTGVLLAAPAAVADVAAERALAERFAPVVRLVEQEEPCGPGEPFQPSDVEAFLDNDTVALRGPWDEQDLLQVGPGATDLADLRLDSYYLDFPGNPLRPGCDYEKWADQVTAGTPPTFYAHVATEPGRPDRLALQYWFFYPFNDYKNTHEGDWEMIQLVFPTGDPLEALGLEPLEVGYSQHEGVEVAAWDDDKLERVDDTHPVVYPGAGSHANQFEPALHLGRSAQEGFGCDDTRGAVDGPPAAVDVLPHDPAAASQEFPWLDFRGRWGQRERAFFNGPTGPSDKERWTAAITFQEERGRDRSYAVPAGGILGTRATDLFCSGVESGSDVLRLLLDNPGGVGLALAVLALLAVLVVRRMAWRPSAPFRVARRRQGGQVLAAAARAYRARWRTFVGIGSLLVPVALAVAGLDSLILEGPEVAGVAQGGEDGGFRVLLTGLVGWAAMGLAIVAVLAAASRALADLDSGRPTSVRSSYRSAGRSAKALAGGFAVSSMLVLLAGLSVVLVPVAVALAVAWVLYVPVVVWEGRGGLASLGRSARLVRHRLLKVGTLLLASVAVATAVGPLLGLLIMLSTDLPLSLVNVVAGVTYSLLMPYLGLTLTYAYADARVSAELAATDESPSELPAEVDLTT